MRPLRTWPRIAGTLAKLKCTSPAITAVSDAAVPLYGMCAMFTPVRALKSSPARCWLVPAPADE